MRISQLAKKITGLTLAATMVLTFAACNTKIKVSYDYDAKQYIKLGQYKGIEATVDVTAIKKKLVDEKIKNDLEDVTEYNAVSRASTDDDQVTVTFTGSIGGSKIDGFSSDGYTLILGKDTFNIPGFVEALYGMQAGDSKIVTLVVPEGIKDAENYANKRIVYEIQMAKVEQPIVPMLTDAYAKEYHGYDTLDAYRQGLEEEMKETIDEQISDGRKKAVLEKLQSNAQIISLPENMLNSKTEELRSSINFYSIMYGMSVDEYCRDRYQMSFEEYVKKSCAQDLIIQAIVEEEQLSITEYEYKGDLDEFAKNNGFADETKFVEKYGKDKIVKNMLIQKAVDVVMNSAVITEK